MKYSITAPYHGDVHRDVATICHDNIAYRWSLCILPERHLVIEAGNKRAAIIITVVMMNIDATTQSVIKHHQPPAIYGVNMATPVFIWFAKH
jgi:hypothetical protein